MKIDLVYLWCDGNDPAWQERRESYMPHIKKQSKDRSTFCRGRIADNNELKHSLRSVEMYAPWINHIYIVTDNQCPEWLETSNPKISIVNQNDLLPKEVLPVFNSCAIELALINIEGLSEYFLYACDDMMFGRKVEPSLFVNEDGTLNCRFIPGAAHDHINHTHYRTLAKAERVISEDFGVDMYRKQTHHNIDIYSKSVIRGVLDKYPEWANLTINNKFRTVEDMQRHIFSLYAVATGQGVAIYNQNKEPKYKGIKRLFGVYRGVDSMYVAPQRLSVMTNRIKSETPALICFNDDENTSDGDRKQLRKLLQKLYPKKSSFEK